MNKRKYIEVEKLNVVTNQQLYHEVKNEIKEIYQELSDANKNNNQDLFLKILLEKLDRSSTSKENYIRILFLLSIYCSYFHKLRNKVQIRNFDNTLNDECFKKNNFVILDMNYNHKILLEDLIAYFNTDANNLENITGRMMKIMNDLDKIEVEIKKNKK